MSVIILAEEFTLGLATLTESTVLFCSQQYDNDQLVSRGFLMKRTRGDVWITGMTASDGPLLFGICRGDQTVAEIGTSLNAVQAKADLEIGAATRNVYRETLSLVGRAEEGMWAHVDIKWGGGGGIPQAPDVGWRCFVYNLSPDLTTGATVRGLLTHYGVWL